MPYPKALRQSREAALDAIAGDYGVESPTISRVGWLQTLLREIEETPGIKELLMRYDPSSMHEMLQECRALVDEGTAAIEILRQSA